MPSETRRLHPASILFDVWRETRWVVLPALGLLVFGAVGGISLWVAFYLGVFAFVRSLLRYMRFTYTLTPEELIVREGMVERTERHVPLERIQDLRTEQSVLHRLLGVTTVHVETAGGSGPEASLVVSLRDVERLRDAILREPRSGLVPTAQEQSEEPVDRATDVQWEVLRRVGFRELVVAGLTGNALGAGLAVIGGTWAFADDVLPGDVYEKTANAIWDALRDTPEVSAATAIGLGITLLAAFVLISAVGAVLWSVIRYHGFSLTRSGDSLRIEYGLFTRRSASLPRRRIQVVEVRQNLLMRAFGYAAILAETAGHTSDDGADRNESAGVLVPIIRRDEALALLPLLLPEFEPTEPPWRRVASVAIARSTRKAAILFTLAAGASFWAFHTLAALWPLALIPVAYCASRFDYRAFQFALDGRFFYVRRGWAGRSLHVVPLRNLQSVAVRQSPFDRRLGVGTLSIDSAGQSLGGSWHRIGNILVDELWELTTALAHGAAALRADVNLRLRPASRPLYRGE